MSRFQSLVVLPAPARGSRPLAQQGVLTRIRWADPHTRLLLDVTGPDGATVVWLLEFESVAALVQHGLRSADVRLGEQVRARGFHVGNDAHAAVASSVTFLDGRRFYAAAADSTATEPIATGGPVSERRRYTHVASSAR